MDIYPFFLECSKHYENDHKKKTLESLAFGCSDLIMKRGKNTKVLITSKGEFIIPNHYTDAMKMKLDEFLWNSTDGYYKMQNDIKESYNTWINVKKKDKLRMIDYYVLSKHQKDDMSFNDIIILKSIITIALMLKLISAENIVYSDGKIMDIKETFTKDKFNALEVPLYFPQSAKHKLKTVWTKWLKSVDASAVLDKYSTNDETESIASITD